MNITQVQVFLNREFIGGVVTPRQAVAKARVTIADSLVLTGISIYETTLGFFVSYPSDPDYKGEDYKQLFYPVTHALRSQLEEAIINKYYKEVANA